jgi:hypothetical protein
MIAVVFFLPILIQGVSAFFHQGEVTIAWNWIFPCAAMVFLYRWLFVYFMGGTIGKLILGLRVVNFPDQRPVTLMQALIRALTDSLSLFFSQGLRALALLRFDRRHVSDWVAETWVRQRFEPEGVPRPRPVVAVLLCLYFSISGFYSIYCLVQKSDLDAHGMTFTSWTETDDSLQSGE